MKDEWISGTGHKYHFCIGRCTQSPTWSTSRALSGYGQIRSRRLWLLCPQFLYERHKLSIQVNSKRFCSFFASLLINSNFRHVRGDKTIVCKHWLRGLCKKGDSCEFLHEYDMTKMPECYFYSRFSKFYKGFLLQSTYELCNTKKPHCVKSHIFVQKLNFEEIWQII